MGKTRWWFQRFFFTHTKGNDPIGLIFFRWVETTNQGKWWYTWDGNLNNQLPPYTPFPKNWYLLGLYWVSTWTGSAAPFFMPWKFGLKWKKNPQPDPEQGTKKHWFFARTKWDDPPTLWIQGSAARNAQKGCNLGGPKYLLRRNLGSIGQVVELPFGASCFLVKVLLATSQDLTPKGSWGFGKPPYFRKSRLLKYFNLARSFGASCFVSLQKLVPM